jgi:hypothetical protein
MNTYFKKIILCMLPIFFITTYITHAQPNPPLNANQNSVNSAVSNLKDKTLQQLVVDTVTIAGRYVLQLLLALTVFVFLYGLMKFMFKGQESDTARAEGRQVMMWGIIGLFVITSIWGLVAIATSLLGHESIVVPQFR